MNITIVIRVIQCFKGGGDYIPAIIDNNKVLVTSIREVLDVLQQQLHASGINKLKRIDYKGNNARITCPIHKNGAENTPSCDILLEDKITNGYNGHRTVNAGTVHCFSCGYTASLSRFVADCLSIPYRKANEWLLEFVDYDISEDIRDVGDLDLNDVALPTNNYNTLPIITCDQLKSYDYIHQYMFDRHLTEDIIEKYEVGYSPEEDALTFPVYVDGKCLFVAKRKVKFKMFELPEIDPKPIYGMDYVNPTETVYITESVINALTLATYGLQAIALFGVGSDYQLKQLNDCNIRKFVICLDGDRAGKIGRSKLIKALSNKIVTYIDLPFGKDINDLTKEEFFSLEQQF